MKSNSSGGNVLFLILIAVALFAALAYAVSHSSRESGGSTSPEKAKANAAQIIQFGNDVRQAIVRIKISKGCTDTTLDFSNNIYKTVGGTATITVNSNAPASKICNIFDIAGGAINPVVPVAAALDLTNSQLASAGAYQAGHIGIRVGQIKGDGTDAAVGTASANDLVFIQAYINKATCVAINNLLGVGVAGADPPTPTATGFFTNPSNGSFSSSSLQTDPAVDGKIAFCKKNTAGDYQFLQVLVER